MANCSASTLILVFCSWEYRRSKLLNLVLDTDDGRGIVIKESDEVDGSC
jgi:hypothetical protein